MKRDSLITNGHHYDPIIKQLTAERKRQGLTLQRLAEQIGRRSYQAIWQWEGLTHDPTLANLRQWAGALGYDVVLVPLNAGEEVGHG